MKARIAFSTLSPKLFNCWSELDPPRNTEKRSSMALENCLRVTTVGTGLRPQCLHPSSSREKLVFPNYRGFKKCLSKLTLSKPSSVCSAAGSNRKSRVICNAREAVNEGNPRPPLCWLLASIYYLSLRSKLPSLTWLIFQFSSPFYISVSVKKASKE